MKLAVVGLDSPHAPEFARLFRQHPGLGGIAGAVAVPPSPDFPRSVDRAAGFADELAGLGVPVVGAVGELPEAPDAFLVTAVDPRTHLALLDDLLGFGRLVFVHTRLAMDEDQAREAFERADSVGVALDVASPKRFAAGFAPLLAGRRATAISLRGPAPRERPLPPFHWYGVHLVDLAITALGPGVSAVSVEWSTPETFRVALTWGDGREAVLDCSTRPSAHVFGRVAGEDFALVADDVAHLALLAAIIRAVETGTVVTRRENAIEIVRVTDMVSRAIVAQAAPDL